MRIQESTVFSYLSIFPCVLLTYFAYGGRPRHIPAPRNYCMTNFNGSDCGGKPTPVFSYYKPGSRCEMEIWRGCPTGNIFDDEYECSHFCIGSLLRWDLFSFSDNDDFRRCVDTLNPRGCDKLKLNKTMVWTYDWCMSECIQREWLGCKTKNKFDTEIACIQACGTSRKPGTFKGLINTLGNKEAKEINEILDDFIKNDANDTEPAEETTETGPQTEETPAEEVEAPAEEAPAEEAPAEEAPAEEPPAEETAAEEAPATEAPAEEVPTPDEGEGSAEEVETT